MRVVVRIAIAYAVAMTAWLLAADGIDTGLRVVLDILLPSMDPLRRILSVTEMEGFSYFTFRSDLIPRSAGVAVDLRTIHFTIVIFVTLALAAPPRDTLASQARRFGTGLVLLVALYAASAWVLVAWAVTVGEPHAVGLPEAWYGVIDFIAHGATDTGLQVGLAIAVWLGVYGRVVAREFRADP